MNDSRNPGYISDLYLMVEQIDLKEQIKFLGFIDRQDQLILMKNSIAIIQPSKFEGWSTVVEDAKCLNHPILVSDINVHREQLGADYKCKFQVDKPEELASLMKETLANKIPKSDYHYGDLVDKFGEEFLKIIEDVIKN